MLRAGRKTPGVGKRGHRLMPRSGFLAEPAGSIVSARSASPVFRLSPSASGRRSETDCKRSRRDFSICASEKRIGTFLLAAISAHRSLNSPVPFTVRGWPLNFTMAIRKAASIPASLTSRFNET